MKRVYKKKSCCGCEACANICPKQAITMEPDRYGFVYPVINNNLCIDCRLCKKVCAFQNIPVTSDVPMAVYAAVNRNKQIIKNSSSGGIFGALASIVLEKNGIVFGCAWNHDMNPEHICIDKLSDLSKLQGSKYVQSRINNTYIKVQEQLRNEKYVLFTGTPCQVAALKSFLGKDYDNLITADLICHGVPSQAFFNDYINHLEAKYNGKCIDINFRDKSNGWSLMVKLTYIKNSKKYEKKIPNSASYYYNYFLNGYIYRDSCYNCKYAGGTRQGDFTMGDYWGIEKHHPDIITKYGVSALLINNKKGMELCDKLMEYLELTPSTFEQVRENNGQLCQPIPMSSKREEILEIWINGGAEALARRFKVSNKEKILNVFRTYMPYTIKEKVKKYILK